MATARSARGGPHRDRVEVQRRYLVGGRELRSELPLPSLSELRDPEETRGAGASHAEGALELIMSAEPFGDGWRWLYPEDGDDAPDPWRAVGVGGGGERYLIRIFGLADFLLSRGSGVARVFVASGAPRSAVEPLFLEQVLPLWWSLLGRPCLHASAVAWGEGERARAIAFAGISGAGKSTLATSLAGEGGLLSDDCLALDAAEQGVIVHPGHRAARLRADSAEALFASAEVGELAPAGGKRRVPVPVPDRALPLARVYLLEPVAAGGDARAVRLTPRDAMSRLAACLFRIDPDDRSLLEREFDVLGRIAGQVAVARLLVPRRFDALAAVRAAIAADLAGDLAKK
jgi:hypothetical protein